MQAPGARGRAPNGDEETAVLHHERLEVVRECRPAHPGVAAEQEELASAARDRPTPRAESASSSDRPWSSSGNLEHGRYVVPVQRKRRDSPMRLELALDRMAVKL